MGLRLWSVTFRVICPHSSIIFPVPMVNGLIGTGKATSIFETLLFAFIARCGLLPASRVR